MDGGAKELIMRVTTILALGLLVLTAASVDAQDACYITVIAPAAGGNFIFSDGFENGDVGAWVPEPGAPRFSARAADDLFFTVDLYSGAFNETAVVHLKVMLPSGHLYQETAYPVATASTRADSGEAVVYRRVKGYPYPVRERELTEVRGDRGPEEEFTVSFPVGGTQIVRNALYGEWKVVGFLDDAEQPCGAAAPFVISE